VYFLRYSNAILNTVFSETLYGAPLCFSKHFHQLTLKPVYIDNPKGNPIPLLQDFNLYYYSVGCSARSHRSNHVPHLRCGRLYFDIICTLASGIELWQPAISIFTVSVSATFFLSLLLCVVHLLSEDVPSREDTFLSWHLAPVSEVTRGLMSRSSESC
jgi:hypothetical protein